MCLDTPTHPPNSWRGKLPFGEAIPSLDIANLRCVELKLLVHLLRVTDLVDAEQDPAGGATKGPAFQTGDTQAHANKGGALRTHGFPGFFHVA
eukprot:SAG11_NODE_2028_length_3906_cov_1.458892_3_plen_93_part_00